MASRFHRWFRRPVVPEIHVPHCWLVDLIHSQMSTGNFGKMARDAVAKARTDKRYADADLYAAMEAQIADYWADINQ